MNDPTPFERLAMENDDLRARLQLADERAFEQAATIARLRAERAELLSASRACVSTLSGLATSELNIDDAMNRTQRRLNIYFYVWGCVDSVRASIARMEAGK